MPDPGSPWERANPGDGFGYLPFPIRSAEDQAKWDACAAHYAALAAGARSDETRNAAQSEGRQSGPNESEGNAQ